MATFIHENRKCTEHTFYCLHKGKVRIIVELARKKYEQARKPEYSYGIQHSWLRSTISIPFIVYYNHFFYTRDFQKIFICIIGLFFLLMQFLLL